MGNKEKEFKQEDTMIDFLYKDTKLIDSFYSQLFGGNLTLVKKLLQKKMKVIKLLI